MPSDFVNNINQRYGPVTSKKKSCPKCNAELNMNVLSCDCGYQFLSSDKIAKVERLGVRRSKMIKISSAVGIGLVIVVMGGLLTVLVFFPDFFRN